MGIKQFLGIKWINNAPQLLFYDATTHSLNYEEAIRKYRNKKNSRKKM